MIFYFKINVIMIDKNDVSSFLIWTPCNSVVPPLPSVLNSSSSLRVFLLSHSDPAKAAKGPVTEKGLAGNIRDRNRAPCS